MPPPTRVPWLRMTAPPGATVMLPVTTDAESRQTTAPATATSPLMTTPLLLPVQLVAAYAGLAPTTGNRLTSMPRSSEQRVRMSIPFRPRERQDAPRRTLPYFVLSATCP